MSGVLHITNPVRRVHVYSYNSSYLTFWEQYRALTRSRGGTQGRRGVGMKLGEYKTRGRGPKGRDRSITRLECGFVFSTITLESIVPRLSWVKRSTRIHIPEKECFPVVCSPKSQE